MTGSNLASSLGQSGPVTKEDKLTQWQKDYVIFRYRANDNKDDGAPT